MTNVLMDYDRSSFHKVAGRVWKHVARYSELAFSLVHPVVHIAVVIRMIPFVVEGKRTIASTVTKC